LGLVYQQMEPRQVRPDGETVSQRRRREGRESHLWTDGVAGVGPAPEGGHWVDVADSGGDFFGLMRRSQAEGHAFLIRFCQNRCVAIDTGTEEPTASHLRDAVRSLDRVEQRESRIAARRGRPARVAWLSIAGHRVRIDPPRGVSRFRAATPIAVTVLRIGEADPPAGEAGLEWVLGYSGAVVDAEYAWEVRGWYEYRWPIADKFHQVEKSGCGEERLRFETWPRRNARWRCSR
jgi:hypothetical protein